jgi:hypothetical protein
LFGVVGFEPDVHQAVGIRLLLGEQLDVLAVVDLEEGNIWVLEGVRLLQPHYARVKNARLAKIVRHKGDVRDAGDARPLHLLAECERSAGGQ